MQPLKLAPFDDEADAVLEVPFLAAVWRTTPHGIEVHFGAEACAS